MATTPFTVTADTDAVLVESLQYIPRYLFRVFDSNSPGTTTLTRVSSPAFDRTSQPGADLYRNPSRPQAAAQLNAHLRWRCPHGHCNLMSWTSSLLFALQYTLYRHQTSHQKLDLSEIRILVIDTQEFDEGTFARDLGAIEAFRHHDTSQDRENLQSLHAIRDSGRYYFGEYLSQGKLTIDPTRAKIVTMGDLIDRGLFEICPELGDESFWNLWAKRVNVLRRALSPVQEADVETVMNVASAFGDFEIPVALMLFSMSPDSIGAATQGYIQAFLDRYPRNLLMDIAERSLSLLRDERLPELERFYDLTIELRDQTSEASDEQASESSSPVESASETSEQEDATAATSGEVDTQSSGLDETLSLGMSRFHL